MMLLSSRSLSACCAEMRDKGAAFIVQSQAEGINAFIDETYRNEKDQNADFAKGRDANGNVIDKHAIVTNARYGQSPHNCTTTVNGIIVPSARAFDFAIELDGGTLDWNGSDAQWLRALDIGRALGLMSGEDWKCGLKDEPHFELPDWKTYDPASYTPQISPIVAGVS